MHKSHFVFVFWFLMLNYAGLIPDSVCTTLHQGPTVQLSLWSTGLSKSSKDTNTIANSNTTKYCNHIACWLWVSGSDGQSEALRNFDAFMQDLYHGLKITWHPSPQWHTFTHSFANRHILIKAICGTDKHCTHTHTHKTAHTHYYHMFGWMGLFPFRSFTVAILLHMGVRAENLCLFKFSPWKQRQFLLRSFNNFSAQCITLSFSACGTHWSQQGSWSQVGTTCVTPHQGKG